MIDYKFLCNAFTNKTIVDIKIINNKELILVFDNGKELNIEAKLNKLEHVDPEDGSIRIRFFPSISLIPLPQTSKKQFDQIIRRMTLRTMKSFFNRAEIGEVFTYSDSLDYGAVRALANLAGFEILYCVPNTIEYRRYGCYTCKITGEMKNED